MASNDKNPAPQAHAHHPPEGTIGWFFYEFSPIILFGGLFVLMCVLPMALIPSNATMLTPTKFWELIRKVVLTPWALGIMASFIGAFCITFWATRWIGMYMLMLVLVSFGIIFAIYPEASMVFYIQWIALFMVVDVLVAIIFFPQRAEKQRQPKK